MNIIGKRVKIVGEHAHTGEFGIVDKIERTYFGSVGFVIKLEECPHGTEGCFVFKPENLEVQK